MINDEETPNNPTGFDESSSGEAPRLIQVLCPLLLFEVCVYSLGNEERGKMIRDGADDIQ